MKIGIIGAGAMGCLYTSMLAEKHSVTLFDVWQPSVDAINADGITVSAPNDVDKVIRVPALMSGAGHEPLDLVILFVKDMASESALDGNRAIIGADTLLLSLQNGMGNYEIMQRFAPAEHILLGTTKHNCVAKAPDVIYHSGAGITHIGSPAGDRAAADRIAEAFGICGIEAEACDNVNHLIWEKLFVNMTINPITALLGSTIGVIASDPDVRAAAYALICEAAAVAAADGEEFDPDAVFAALMDTAAHLATGKASMCQDIERHRRTEIDFINGAVVRLGKKYGIPTPAHEMIVRLVHAKEKL